MRRGKSRKAGKNKSFFSPLPRFPDFPLLRFSDFPKKTTGLRVYLSSCPLTVRDKCSLVPIWKTLIR